MSIQITDIPTRHIDFSALIAKPIVGDLYDNALRNLNPDASPENWYGMGGEIAKITADTTDELEEKTLDLISEVERMARCAVYQADGSVEGYDFNVDRDYAKSCYENQTCYGHAPAVRSMGEAIVNKFPNSYLVSEADDDDIGEPLVYFFMDQAEYDSLLREGDDLALHQESYPLNTKSKELGIDGPCYDMIYQLPLSVAQQYFSIETN